ncbi:MAG: hypothetical protein RL357_364 [Pseudomonadota bacterium]
MARPPLTPNLTPEEFVRWYWLKSELRAFCTEMGISAQGAKVQLQARIHDHLHRPAQRDPRVQRSGQSRGAGAMPAQLTLQTRIEKGWKLNQALRAFFEDQLSVPFRFNQALRDLFKEPSGRTLGDAVEIFKLTRNLKPDIGQQFQYNQHIRTFFIKHPDASLQEAIAAWRALRAQADALPASEPRS